MKTDKQVLAELNSQSKNLDLLIKAFDLSLEKSGGYKRNRPKVDMKSKSVYFKSFISNFHVE
jgi:hypothetical protein